MKKIYFIILCILAICISTFCSCSTDDIKEGNVVKFEYEGHDYIRFEYGYGSGRTFSVVHDPKCIYEDNNEDDDDDDDDSYEDYNDNDEDDNVEHD